MGASQGFSGAYGSRIVARATQPPDAASGGLLVIGQRCIAEFLDLGQTPVWSADMAARPADVPALASRIADAVFTLVGQHKVTEVDIVHGLPGVPQSLPLVRQLIPFDFARLDLLPRADRLLTTLPPQELMAGLVEEYVFTEICESVMLGFAAENDARMMAMTRARTNVRQMRDDLRIAFAQARQEQTTTEIIEMSGSAS